MFFVLFCFFIQSNGWFGVALAAQCVAIFFCCIHMGTVEAFLNFYLFILAIISLTTTIQGFTKRLRLH